ncbi:TetR family transcriptional regulator [Roseibium salinum]|nr:TetR family transcriptional regulator [Roseibium salinum]
MSEFSRKGFSGATVERIAAEAGMSKSNLLYYFFSSKEAIYSATLAHILEVWLAPLKNAQSARRSGAGACRLYPPEDRNVGEISGSFASLCK